MLLLIYCESFERYIKVEDISLMGFDKNTESFWIELYNNKKININTSDAYTTILGYWEAFLNYKANGNHIPTFIMHYGSIIKVEN